MSIEAPHPAVGAVRPFRRTALRAFILPQGLALVVGDVLSGILAQIIVNFFLGLFGAVLISWKVTAAWLLLWLLWRAYQGLYPGYGQSPQNELRRHTVSTFQVAVAQVAAVLAVQRFAPSSPGVLVEWVVILVIALPIRYGVRSALIHMKMYGRPVSIIGAGETARMIVQHLVAHPSYGLRPVAAYDDNSSLHSDNLEGVPILGHISLALSQPKNEQAIIGIPSARSEMQQQLVNSVYAVYPITWVVPDFLGIPNQAMQPHNIGALASLEIKNNLRSFRSQFMKRVIDIILSSIGILVISPLLIVIAIVIRLDSAGSSVYKAHRLGKDLVPFECYKFRSMYLDAEEKLQDLLNSDSSLKAEYDMYHKIKNDPRVTRVGRLIRKFSLDELPQIFNVFLGTMSLVGPRPYLLREQEKMRGEDRFISQVRPGMTGYWQVSARSSSTFFERVAMDRFYITNWSPWLDLVILCQTFKVVFIGKGAY